MMSCSVTPIHPTQDSDDEEESSVASQATESDAGAI